MKRTFIIFVIAFVCFFSCNKKAKVIPRAKMIKIYKEIFLADQWLSQNYRESEAADTSFFYAPIFKKYGYTADDYKVSIAYYLKDPTRYARIFKKLSLELEEDIKNLEERVDLEEKLQQERIERQRRQDIIRQNLRLFEYVKPLSQTILDTATYKPTLNLEYFYTKSLDKDYLILLDKNTKIPY